MIRPGPDLERVNQMGSQKLQRTGKRVTIVTIHELYPEATGGVEVFAYKLAIGLRKLGRKVRIIAFCGEPNVVGTYAREGIQVVKILPSRNLPWSRASRVISFLALLSSSFISESLSQSSVFLCLGSDAVLLGLPLRLLFRKKLVVLMIGGDFNSSAASPRTIRERIEKRYFLTSLALTRYADAVVVSSEWMKQGLSELGVRSEKIIKIIGGIDVPEMPVRRRRAADEIRLAYVGRLSRELTTNKQIDLLLNAFKLFNIQFPHSVLTIVGGGSDQERLVTIAERIGLGKSVKFTGYVEHEEVFSYLSESDIFVFPSLMEGMSNSLLEAVLTGVPIVASDIPPNRELLSRVSGSILFRPASTDELAAAMCDMARDIDRKRALAHQAATQLKDDLSFSGTTLAAYEKLLFG